MSTHEWKPKIKHYELVTESGAQGFVAPDPGMYRDDETRWSWSITIPARSAPGESIALGGWYCKSQEEAQQKVDDAIDLADKLANLNLSHLQVVKEIAADKIDMSQDGTCLLCGYGSGCVSSCLHTPDEIRLAFSIAMRLGRHVPRSDETK